VTEPADIARPPQLSEVIVDDVLVAQRDGQVELSARVRSGRGEERLWYRFPGQYEPYLRASGSPFLAALMMPAMAMGERLAIRAPVSARLMRSSRHLKKLLNSWWPQYSRVRITPSRRERVPPWHEKTGRAACFFSMGVDSFHTLLESGNGEIYDTPPVSHLLFVNGFDIRLGNDSLLGAVGESLKRVSAATGKEVVIVETNLRAFTDPVSPWTECHGSAIASVAIALERAFDAVYIASTNSYDELFPWGSHPEIDPRWSTSRMRLIHDGNEYARAEKIARVVEEPIVRQTLRCCWENREGRYNCGRCEKCLRTMAVLLSLGVLGEVRTFPDTYPLEALAEVDWSKQQTRDRFRDVLDAIGDAPSTASVRKAIEGHMGVVES